MKAYRTLAVLAALHYGPAATWLPGLRRSCFPGLAGLGKRDRVALTFDDGPDPESTPEFLRVLDELGVRATFFVLGEKALRHQGLTREISERGHELAVHGWSHDWPWAPSPRRDVRDLRLAASVIGRASGTIPRWYRPPYGILTGGRLAAAVACGLRPVLWSAWGRDWTSSATPDSVRATVSRDLRGGGTILLHDSSPGDSSPSPGDRWRVTLAALPELLAVCRAAGWTAGPLTEHWEDAACSVVAPPPL